MADGVLVFVEGGNPEVGISNKLNPRMASGRNRFQAGRLLGGEHSTRHLVGIPAPTQVKELRLFFVH